MTQEDKQLLLQDLSARLPYAVKVKIRSNDIRTVKTINVVEEIIGFLELDTISPFGFHIEHPTTFRQQVKPYLRPMESMTKEEKEEFENLLEGIVDGVERWDKPDLCEEYDWLNAHYFDYRGLIPKGLALEAPEGMY